MTTLHDDFIQDLYSSRKSPLLIEVQKKHIEQLKKDCASFSETASYDKVYNEELTNLQKNDGMTNIITIDAFKNKQTQILSSIYHLICDTLKAKKSIDSILKSSIYLSTMGLGELIDPNITNKIPEFITSVTDDLENAISSNSITEWLSEKLPGDLLSNTLEEKSETLINNNHQLGSKLFLSKSSKSKMAELANNISKNHTPHQAMQFTLELLTTLAKGAPKLIVINNPFNLDSASFSLLSLLFSYAKDLNQKNKCTGISILFNYTEQQPFDTSKSEDKESFERVKRLRHMVQRYGMLEKPGADIPTPAIKASTFVGRKDELGSLSKAHFNFIKDSHKRKALTKHSQCTLIKGEPGTGKTALINKHLEQIKKNSEFNDSQTNSQIRLQLLNQVGHTSEVTGLASLLQSIHTESIRLTKYYQGNQKVFRRIYNDFSISKKQDYAEYETAVKERKKSWDTIIKAATTIANLTTSYGAIVNAALSVKDAFTLDKSKLQTAEALIDEKSTDKKQEQFDQLNMALQKLSIISIAVDEKAEMMPILIFVDDLQWVDEFSAEFLLTQLLPKFSTELLITARRSDSETSYKVSLEEQKHSPYKLALFNAVKLGNQQVLNANSTEHKHELDGEKNTRTNDTSIKKLTTKIEVTDEIRIEGMDKKTLTMLIESTYENATTIQAEMIASGIIKALSEEEIDDTTQVITLFAVETLNLISDAKFYNKNNSITPIFLPSEEKKGVFKINNQSDQPLINTLENVFAHLRDTYNKSFHHESLQNNGRSYFTLSSYAVMEERLFIIHQYFAQYGDTAIFSLKLSVLIGTPFNSDLLRQLMGELTQLDLTKYPELAPLKEHLNSQSGQSLEPEHLELLEEVFEILKRFQQQNNMHQYRHSLFALFLHQQFRYTLNCLFNYKLNTASLNVFFLFCKKVIEMRFIEIKKRNLSLQEAVQFRSYTLQSLFSLLEEAFLLDDTTWAKDYIDSLLSLAFNYKDSNSINDEVLLLEKSVSITKKLFAQDNEQWAGSYVMCMNNLASNYNLVGRIGKATTLLNTSLSIIEKLYSEESEKWAEGYITCMKNLAISYFSIGQVQKSIKIEERAIVIVEKLYLEHKELWAEHYSLFLNQIAISYASVCHIRKAITLGEKALKITRELYNEDNHRWSENYTKSLVNLATNYNSVGRTEEALCYLKESIGIIEIFYSIRNDKWAELYASYMGKLSDVYRTIGLFDDAISLAQKSIVITQKLYFENNERWAEAYTSNMNNLAVNYQETHRNSEALKLLQDSLDITTKLYINNNELWAKSYSRALLNFACALHSTGQSEEAIIHFKKGIYLTKNLYNGNNKLWGEQYIILLSNLAYTYDSDGKTEKAISLFDKALAITEKLYIPNNSRWKDLYKKTIKSLVLVLDKNNQTSKSRKHLKKLKDLGDFTPSLKLNKTVQKNKIREKRKQQRKNRKK